MTKHVSCHRYQILPKHRKKQKYLRLEKYQKCVSTVELALNNNSKYVKRGKNESTKRGENKTFASAE